MHDAQMFSLLIMMGIVVCVYFYQDFHLGWMLTFAISARITFFDYLFNRFMDRQIFSIGTSSHWWERFRRNGGDFIKIMALLLFIFSILNLYNLL